MSEEAIQDILEQTESDPAFQALFDLFDYGRVYYTQLYHLDSFILKDDSSYLFFCAVVKFFYLSHQGYSHIKYKDIFMRFLDVKINK